MTSDGFSALMALALTYFDTDTITGITPYVAVSYYRTSDDAFLSGHVAKSIPAGHTTEADVNTRLNVRPESRFGLTFLDYSTASETYPAIEAGSVLRIKGATDFYVRFTFSLWIRAYDSVREARYHAHEWGVSIAPTDREYEWFLANNITIVDAGGTFKNNYRPQDRDWET